jgi:hypothetical protein
MMGWSQGLSALFLQTWLVGLRPTWKRGWLVLEKAARPSPAPTTLFSIRPAGHTGEKRTEKRWSECFYNAIVLTTACYIDYSLVYIAGCSTLSQFFGRTFQVQGISNNDDVVYCLSSIIARMDVDNAKENICCLLNSPNKLL